MAWVRDDPDLVARLHAAWPDWDESGENGLAATLDQRPDWTGWDTWEPDARRDYLRTTLDEWYPPEQAGAEDAAADRMAWVLEDPALVDRLNAEWAGWTDAGESGLAAYLDQQDDWAGWETWSDEDKRSYLAASLDVWYPAEPAVEEPAEVEEPLAVEELATEFAEQEIAAALQRAFEAVPEAADLSEDEIREALLEVLAAGAESSPAAQ